MAIFTAIATALLAGTFLAGTIAVPALAGALGLAASIGISYAARALAGTPKSSSTDFKQDSFSIQGTLQAGGDVPRSFNIGYSATAGSLAYGNFWGTSGSTPNAFITQVIALADLPGGSLVEAWVNGELCTLDDVAHPEYGYPVLEYRKGGGDHLWIKYHDGTQTTADAFLVNRVSSAERPYQSTRVGVGVAYVICTALINDTLYTGIPKFKFAVSGVPLYDPSKDSTNGGTGPHRYSDRSTWGGDGDNLPAVQAYNLLRGIYFNGTWLYGVQGMTAARLPAVNWNAQIAKCRATIEGEDGDEPTYRTGGQINVNAQIGNTIEAILTGCQGKISEIGGFYKIHLGAPDSPTFSFTDDDVISTEEQHFAPFFGLSDSVNGITASYPDPSQGWNPETAPPLYNPEFEARDGRRRLLANPSFDFVPYPEQVQRLQKSALYEARRERRHALTLWSKYWFVEPGDVGEWTSWKNNYNAKLFRCDGAVDKANLDVTLDLTEVDSSDHAWDRDSEYRPVTGGSTVFPRPAPQGIVDWSAEAAILKDASGLSRRPAIRMAWDGNMPGVVGVQYEVRLASDHSDVTRGRTDQLASGAILVTQSLLPNTAYQVRGQYLPSSPRDMLWSDWITVTTPNVKLSVIEFETGLRDFVSNELRDALHDVDFTAQRIASLTAEQEAANAIDKRVTRDILSERVGNVQVSISETAQVVQEINGRLGAAWFLSINNDGYVSGMYQYNNGSVADFVVIADNFLVASPALPGEEPVAIFEVAEIDGRARVVIKGDLFADGSIKAQSLHVPKLSSITGDVGELTAGIIRNAAGTLVFNLDASNLIGYEEEV